MILAEAERAVSDWLVEPRQRGSVLPVLGPAGVGKTALLRTIHEQFPSSVLVDCRGLTMDEVAHGLLDEFGIDAASLRGQDPLFDAVVKIRRDAIVLLCNVQWSGSLFTSREPDRIAGPLATTFGAHSRGCVRVVVEADSAHRRVHIRRANEIVLDEEPDGADVVALLGSYPQLRALAASEVRDTPLSVWEFLCSVLQERTDEESLRRLTQQLPDVVAVQNTAAGVTAGFVSDALKYAIRSHGTLAPAEQLAVAEALLTSPASPISAGTSASVHGYGARAAAVHAALGGALPRLLDDRPQFVALCDRISLLEGIAEAWPDGVPMGGTAADAHYLDAEGVAPRSQGEWLSWLHWAAVSRGRTEWADALADSAVRLPWRTSWSRWRPYGIFGEHTGTSGAVDFVELGSSDGIPLVTTQREMPLPTDDEVEEPGDERYLERMWKLTDGTELMTPSVVDVFLDNDGEVDRVVGRAVDLHPVTSEPAHPELTCPQLPRSVRDTAQADDDRWVLGGSGGLFALDVLEAKDPGAGRSRWPSPLVAPTRRAAVWPMPAALLAAEGPDRSWFASCFGEEALRRLEATAIPAGVVHPQTHATLTGIGFPALDGGEPRFLTTVALDRTGLETTEPLGHHEPGYRLGTWLGEEVVLGGESGRVLLASVAGTRLLGSSLRQFMTLVGLYVMLRRSEFPTRHEERDARRSLAAWSQQIDQPVGTSDPWKAAFDGELDVRESL
ncbi:ATP-binding protein [Streptomyces chartreusis]|uniref:ATP-binding protein n=1 Tax=Streptomyces chartreusis TaxID=1969 RepID=UPI000A91AE4D